MKDYQIPGYERWSCVKMGVTYFQTDLSSSADAPSIESVRRRITLDLHTREVLEDRAVDAETRGAELNEAVPEAPADILSYFYYTSESNKIDLSGLDPGKFDCSKLPVQWVAQAGVVGPSALHVCGRAQARSVISWATG